MNKIKHILTIVILLVTFSSVSANVKTEPNAIGLQSMSANKSIELVNRLEVINKMDKSQLNRQEVKNLLAEVRIMNSHLAATDGGIYLSAGALIVILIVLLLVL